MDSSGSVWDIRFHPTFEREMLLVGALCHPKQAHLYNLRTGDVYELMGHAGDVLSVGYSCTGRKCYTGSKDCSIVVRQ